MEMDKPISMPVKDYLMRILSVKMLVSEKVIEAVIHHQFQSANEALKTKDSVEISGFGKFLFNRKKADKIYQRLLDKKVYFESCIEEPSKSTRKVGSIQKILDATISDIKELKTRIDASDANIRRVEK